MCLGVQLTETECDITLDSQLDWLGTTSSLWVDSGLMALGTIVAPWPHACGLDSLLIFHEIRIFSGPCPSAVLFCLEAR